MLRFRLFGIPFGVAGSFWLGAILLSGLYSSRDLGPLAIWIVCVFVSIVVHELGHALLARRFGVPTFVTLYAMGGLTHLPGPRLRRGAMIVVCLAGPAFGFGLYLLVRAWQAYLLPNVSWASEWSETGSHVRLATRFLLFANGYWTLFNLLPVLPLDGGQVFREVLGPSRFRIVRIVGGAVAAGLAILAWRNDEIYLTFFLGVLAFLNFKNGAREMSGGVQGG